MPSDKSQQIQITQQTQKIIVARSKVLVTQNNVRKPGL